VVKVQLHSPHAFNVTIAYSVIKLMIRGNVANYTTFAASIQCNSPMQDDATVSYTICGHSSRRGSNNFAVVAILVCYTELTKIIHDLSQYHKSCRVKCSRHVTLFVIY